ncbi:uncharacterized protein LOC123685970 [Harmonia axyridis]|uniref:uncharacterized protein LOC123685970 n=1 Tax=Harmonia axyridis TaxID=115357 RepID=UPI001E275E0B|nr:uncharacterized protein LOC123685970 [Harmonia axyridis]
MMNKTKNMQSKYKEMHQGTSTTQLRHKIKERFLNTLQEVRNRAIDARRFSNSSDSAAKPKICSMDDLKEILTDNKDLKELITPEEIDGIISEVQKEIGWSTKDEMELYDPEILAVVENLVTNCIICDKSSVNVVCESCGNEHFTESS